MGNRRAEKARAKARTQATLRGARLKARRRVRKDAAHQLWYGRRTLEKHGVPTDLTDWESEFDLEQPYSYNRATVILPLLEEHSEKYRLMRMERSVARARHALWSRGGARRGSA